MIHNGYIDRYICYCFGGGGSSAPAPTPTPPAPPPSKMDEGAAGRQANLDIIRQQQASGPNAMIGTSPLGDESATPSAQKTLLGA